MLSIEAQIAAMDRLIVNMGGRIERCRELAGKGKWPATDIEIRERHLAELREARATLGLLSQHWEAFEQAMITGERE